MVLVPLFSVFPPLKLFPVIFRSCVRIFLFVLRTAVLVSAPFRLVIFVYWFLFVQVIVDVIIRELLNLPEENELRRDYLLCLDR